MEELVEPIVRLPLASYIEALDRCYKLVVYGLVSVLLAAESVSTRSNEAVSVVSRASSPSNNTATKAN